MAKADTTETVATIDDSFEHDELGINVPSNVIERFDPTNIEAYLEALGLTPEDVVFQGDAYPFVADKNDLVGVSLFLVQWAFADNKKFGVEGVSVKSVRLDTGERCSFYDTGTGIKDQLSNETNRRMGDGLSAVRQGLSVPKGLSRSDYDANDSRPAGTTFYLA